MKDSLDRQDVNSFLACRFIIAAGIMFILRPQCLKHIDKAFLARGVATGAFLGTGYIFQTFGLTMTTVAKTGFLTGLYAVIVPLIAAGIFKARVRKLQWLAVTFALIGMAILSLNGLSVGLGEFLVFLSAVMFAFHIVDFDSVGYSGRHLFHWIIKKWISYASRSWCLGGDYLHRYLC